MARVIQTQGHEVVASDIADRGFGRTGVDFLACQSFPRGCGSKVIVLRRRIRWFDMGPLTNHGQHHHAWLFWDCRHERGRPPEMLFAG